MFDFNDAKETLSINDILKYISEYDIFKYYCKNFEDIEISFCSELRVDNKPGCRIYITGENTLRYKDFASGENYNCWNYIMIKYGCTFYESLDIVANDFKISNKKITISPNLIIGKDSISIQPKIIKKVPSVITIMPQNWRLEDYQYWNQYSINFDLLQEYNVIPSKYVYLTKGIKRHIFEYNKYNPCYAYKFTYEGTTSYKIYWPLNKDKARKWLFSGGSSKNIEGYDQLPLHGDILILTKSLKDCMCYNLVGYPAISLQGEANKLEQDFVTKLLKRFNKIIINYDNDEQGIISTTKLVEQYQFQYFYIDKAKDLSDYIKDNGLDKAKELINKLINNG